MKRLFIAVLMIILVSCESVVEVNESLEEQKLVVNSIITNDSLISVNLSLSKTLYGSEASIFENVQEASISLLSDENLIGNLVDYSNGVYMLPGYYASTEIPYRIQIQYSGMEISGETKIPASVPIGSLKFIPNYGITEFGDKYHRLGINFSDPETIVNYYEIAVKYEYLDSIRFIGFVTDYFILFSNDRIIANEIDTRNPDFWSDHMVFSDELLIGDTSTIFINCTNLLQSGFSNKQKITVYFNSISEEYYLLNKKILLYKQSTLNEVWGDISEPVTIYSNIENGYGIFAGYSSDSMSFVIGGK